MEAKHTPTPWFVGEANCYDNFNSHIGVRSLDDWVVCEVQTDVSALPGEANADFIVRAVNSHDALVAALKKIAAIEDKAFGGDWDEIEEARNIAVAALALSGEKP